MHNHHQQEEGPPGSPEGAQLEHMCFVQATWRQIKAEASASRLLDMERLCAMDKGLRSALGINDRSLWLVVAIVEHMEAYNEVGLTPSLPWFLRRLDMLAPLGRVTVSSRGKTVEDFARELEATGFWNQGGDALAREMALSGVPERMCAEMKFRHGLGVPGFCHYIGSSVPALLMVHPDGDITPTPMGLELVMRLRELTPGMTTSANNYGPTLVPALDLALPHTRWRGFPYLPKEGEGLPPLQGTNS